MLLAPVRRPARRLDPGRRVGQARAVAAADDRRLRARDPQPRRRAAEVDPAAALPRPAPRPRRPTAGADETDEPGRTGPRSRTRCSRASRRRTRRPRGRARLVLAAPDWAPPTPASRPRPRTRLDLDRRRLGPAVRRRRAGRPALRLLAARRGRRHGLRAQDRSGNNRTAQYYGSLDLGRPGGLPNNPGTSIRTTGGRASSAAGRSPRRAPTRSSCGSAPRPRRGAISPASRTTATPATPFPRTPTASSHGGDRAAHLRRLAWRSTSPITTPARLQRRRLAPPRGHQHRPTRRRPSTSTAPLSSAARRPRSSLHRLLARRAGQPRVPQHARPSTETSTTSSIYHSVLPAARVAAHWAAR